ACQIARDVGMRRPTVWSMMHRIRVAMVDDMHQNELLHGIVEADETYIGGKPRKKNKRNDDDSNSGAKRGRGTKKMPVIGVVERFGRVIAEPAIKGKLNRSILSAFIRRNVDTDASLLMTDEFPGYRGIGSEMRHSTVNHAAQYVDGMTH